MFYYYLFLVWMSVVHALPIQSCPSDYVIPIDSLSQLISTHWHYDHLDTLITGTYRAISEQFQTHIEITLNEPAQDELMDYEILQAQISGAIQAHTEGSLPLAWDGLADRLSRVSLEQYIRNTIDAICPLENETVHAQCIKKHASSLVNTLNEYIQTQFTDILTTLDTDILPDLLQKTSLDLGQVLDYFNRLFHTQLHLTLSPWTPILHTLTPLITASILHHNHLTEFFSDYACLSRL